MSLTQPCCATVMCRFPSLTRLVAISSGTSNSWGFPVTTADTSAAVSPTRPSFYEPPTSTWRTPRRPWWGTFKSRSAKVSLICWHY